MNHDKLHNMHEKQNTQKHNCTCGKNCINCDAEKLSVSCCCNMESRQYEYSLRSEISALLMSISSIIVATNAVLLKRVEPKLKEV